MNHSPCLTAGPGLKLLCYQFRFGEVRAENANREECKEVCDFTHFFLKVLCGISKKSGLEMRSSATTARLSLACPIFNPTFQIQNATYGDSL